MVPEISNIATYGYTVNAANLKNNIQVVSNNTVNTNKNTPEAVIEQNVSSTNSALLFEYTQNIAKSNIAQQIVLDSNLKETLKFLKSPAARTLSRKETRKFGTLVEHIFTDNDIEDFDSKEKYKESDESFLLELFEIEIDNSKENIFAA